MKIIAKKRNTILMLVALASIFVLIYCGIRLSLYTYDSYRSSVNVDELKKYIGETNLVLCDDEESGRVVKYITKVTDTGTGMLDKYSRLYSLNEDMAGWISIPDTSIEYPVMYTPAEEEYYLHRDFYKAEIKSGLPFIDYRCDLNKPSRNIIIYGHNMKDGSMFADLFKYEDKDFYDQHRYIRYDSLYREGIYEIIAVFKTEVANRDQNVFKYYNHIDFEDDAEIEEYLQNVREISLYETKQEAECTDEFITLSTCDHSVEDGRFVVVARKVYTEQ